MSTCLACNNAPYGFRKGRWCGKHRQAMRTNGHPLQFAIRQGELTPYIKEVQQRRRSTPAARIWSLLDARWRDLAADCKSRLDDDEPGIARSRWQREADRALFVLATEADPGKVVDVILALFLMRWRDPRRFQSDRAFSFQLARCTRRLAPSVYRSWRSPRTGRLSTHMANLHQRAAEIVASRLLSNFGVAGMGLVKVVEADERRKREQATALVAAVGELVDGS